MNPIFQISRNSITLQKLQEIQEKDLKLDLDPELRVLLYNQRIKLDLILSTNDKPIYGINTGFGALCNTKIPDDQLHELQSNLVRSHACGFGAYVSEDLARLVLLLKIIGLSQEYSAVRPELIEFLILLYNHRIIPVIPEMGSLGASGDLAPLAHLSLSAIGEGLVNYNNKILESNTVFKDLNIKVPFLKAKEGLALLNGTQYSLALLITAVLKARRCYHQANLNAALSMESFNCNISFLHPKIQEIRNQSGQVHAANEISSWLVDSDIQTRSNKSVQDPYSFRCAPQVHGASFDAIKYCETIAENELNSVTDNPLLISSTEVISGGNFHAQPLALASDFLCLATTELANISERRIYQLICGTRGLPDFLTNEPGLNSGFMIVQYAAAAAVSMNKQLSSPASVDSIISSKGQEDHVSMAANAGLKCNKIAEQTELVLAMEWMTATRAWNFRKDWKLQNNLEKYYKNYLDIIPFKKEDHIPSNDYEKTILYLRSIAY
ncbi:MAG: histidine ammonia-lyase [Saprospiraceae bacterium]|nr:histidine ammonia-lyase [Saprospiraceae bacterium]